VIISYVLNLASWLTSKVKCFLDYIGINGQGEETKDIGKGHQYLVILSGRSSSDGDIEV